MSKRGLGRGLDALLPTRGNETGLETREGLKYLAIDEIRANPHQPRSTFEQEALEELTASIRELGVLQPLLVREADGGYELIAGERRLRASRAAGLSHVPAMVIDTDDRGSMERALVENIHRSDLDPIEEAAAYKQLIDEAGITQEELGSRLGRNRATIANSMRLLELPNEIQRMLIERRISAAHGKALLGLQGNPFQTRIAKRAASEKLSVRETEQLVRKFQQMSTASTERSETGSRPPQVPEAQRALADHLQTRVRVEMGKRKGKIVLDFVSLDELERIVAIITGEAAGSKTETVEPN
ncbi:MAG: ParB/RepB/Spo0J family partition protein [Actinomycetota bacterium]